MILEGLHGYCETLHVVVEELLQLLVTEIDAYLLEGVEFEDLKT